MNINMKDVLSEELSLSNSTDNFNTKSSYMTKKYNYFIYLNGIKDHSRSIDEQLDLYENICSKEYNTEKLVNATKALCEAVRNKLTKEIVPSTKRVRNGESTDHMNRHKIGTAVKAKITKLKTATGASAKPNIPKKEEAQKEATLEKCYDKIIETCNISEVINTIISNQKKLNRRFDFNVFAKNNSYDLQDCVFGLCDLIDTYDISRGTKYKVALENIQYTLYKNSIHYDKKQLLEAVTDYFLLTPQELTEEYIDDLRGVLEKVNGYSEDDINSLYIMQKNNTSSEYYNELGMDILDIERIHASSILESGDKKTNPVVYLINGFKTSAKKTPDALKSLIYKIYTKDSDDIIDGTPNLLSCIRYLAILGGFSLGIIPGCVVLMADYAIKLTLSRKQIKKLIAVYNKELEKTEKKIDRLKNEKAIERAEEYKDSLEDAIYKLEDYEDDLNKDYDIGLDKDKKEDDDDDDFSFESYIIDIANDIEYISEGIEKLSDIDAKYIDMAIANSVPKMDEDCIITLTNICVKKPNIIDPLSLKREYERRLKDERCSISKNYGMIDTLNNSIWDINANGTIVKDVPCYEDIKTVKEDIDIAYLLADNLSDTSFVNEVSITNSLKLAAVNLKRGIRNLSDKEKILSRNVDAAVDRTIKSAERSLQKGNREAVIKGQLLPSASKVIKWAITTGAAWLVNPAIAVIGLLGAIGCAKRAQAKERQLILDEIETELQICEKQIKLAEDKDDMKAYRSLLMTKRSLERQHQRIRYKMKVDFGQAAQTRTADLGKMTTTMKND